MMTTLSKNEIVLGGCTTEPLSNYLKALGILRIVSEQADPEARGYWKNGVFVLKTSLGQEQLEAFFLEKYSPAPIISPWNNAAGFLKRNNTTGILDKFLNSKDARLNAFSKTVKCARIVVTTARTDGLALDKIGKPGNKAGEDAKNALIVRLRNALPDLANQWVDAALVIRESDWKSFSLLGGGGGNDGRAEFSVTFIEQIEKIILSQDRNSRKNLLNALFGTESNGFGVSMFGQFNPSAAGNFNASNDFKSDWHTNPWDYVLSLEGALVFAGAIVRRYKDTRVDSIAAFPFSVRHLASGYGTAAKSEETRSELWLPTWERPTRLAEIKTLFSEGRAEFSGRSAKNAIEFAQSIAALGTDRGLTAFQRYAFIKRNGMSFFAVKLDAFGVQGGRNAELLREPIEWTGRSRGSKDSEAKLKALRKIEENLLRLCHRGFENPAPAMETIAALGMLMQESVKRKDGWNLKPRQILDAGWLEKAYDGSPEFRLAASLASALSPEFSALFKKPQTDAEKKAAKDVEKKAAKDVEKWLRFSGKPVCLLNNIMADRIMRIKQQKRRSYFEPAKTFVRLDDINSFIVGNIDDRKIINLMFGLMFLKWNEVRKGFEFKTKPSRSLFSGAGYALAKLCHAGVTFDGKEIRLVPEIHKRLASGDAAKAIRLALWRLRADGCHIPSYAGLAVPELQSERTAAALVFPLDCRDINFLKQRIIQPEKVET